MGRKSADFSAKIKSADFRIVSGLFGRPFFGILAVFFFSVKLEKNRPIFADRPIFAAISGQIGRFFADKKSAHEQ
ncbi:unnamed protein product [Staurois parvus]|uniref:Uncharacterized protein n=1 Tax=Staurois parvus TaxID=386267 RepID=A0ABN9DE61_9NEOB|nr:unnamed protein product [Staurois parvus]